MFHDVANRLQQSSVVGIIPTDTVYGVVARAHDQEAVKRLYAIKHREGKPGTIIAASLEQLEELGLKHRYLKAVEQYWPGALSVVIPCGPELKYLHQGQLGLAVRIPDNKDILKLLEQTGPLLTSSANHPGEPISTNVAQAKQYFGDKVDFYIDGGDLSANQPSTVIRIVDDAVEILRQGAVHIKEADIAE